MRRHLFWLVTLLVAGLSVVNAINTEPGRLGCFKDNATRVLKHWRNTHEKNTVRFCRNMCQDFAFAGVELGRWCMCGDEIPPQTLPDSRCNHPCSGDKRQTCGGVWALEVFPIEPKPVMIGKPMGCFQDTAARVWKTGLINLQSNSPKRCFDSCRGFRYAGMEAGTWCVCGDSLPPTPLPTSKCQSQCSGSADKTCGGGWALEVFELSEMQNSVQVVERVPFEYLQSGELGIYKLFDQRKTWGNAWQQCDDDDAHLLIINSEDEAKFVRSLFAQVPSESRMHAGFHDLLRKGTYRTLYNENLSTAGYNVWSTKYPMVPSPVQHCGSVDARAKLAQIDGNCGAQAMFVCEKKSESPDANGKSLQFDVRAALEALD